MPRPLVLALALLPALAQAQNRYAEEPTAGLALPTIPIAGDADATAVSRNPGGLVFLGDYHLDLAFTGRTPDLIGSSGTGIGLYVATPLDLPFIPRLAVGAAVEKLLPPRVALAPDPGEPLRLSLAGAYQASAKLGIGFTWHHYIDSGGGALHDIDTLDVGLSYRFGAYLAGGLVVRDLLTPTVDILPVQRRYDGELDLRPFGDDRLALGVGAELGERRLDIDPRLYVSVRLARGTYLRSEFAMRTLFELDDPAFPAGNAERVYDFHGTLGLELSFGGVGAAAYATGGVNPDGDAELLGGTGFVRWSDERYPSALRRPAQLQRLKIGSAMTQRSLTRILLHLRRLERDKSTKGLFLVLEGVDLGWAGVQDVRDAIHRLRAKGKKVYAYLMVGNTRDYYLASACDKIYLDAAGGLRVQGMSSTAIYFKSLFDKVGVLAQFEKIEEYKSAPEAFTREGASEKAREMKDELLDDVYASVVADIAADRKLTPEAVRKMFDDGPYTAAEAAAKGIVDAIGEPEEIDVLVEREFGGGISVADGIPAERSTSWELPLIAVVYIDGDIVDGKSTTVPLLGERLVGGDTIAQALTWARKNPRVKAVVIRVDSPGGSALASEVIAREVFKLRGRKPVVISMGDVAASGGYFAAAGGDVIYAQRSTVTGSIGIFTGKFDLSGLLSRIGITWETSRRGSHADMESYFRPYTDEERHAIKEKLRYFYGRFVKAVMKGRKMTFEQVDAVGRGHVWTGRRAKELNLVDNMGSVAEAIYEAKRRAGMAEVQPTELVMLPSEPSSLLGRLLKFAGGQAETSARIGPVQDLLRLVPGSLLVGGDVPQARMDVEIVIE